MDLIYYLENMALEKQELAICWLGQAGFYIKDAAGKSFVIDPYMSNCGERLRGFKRMSAMLINPSNFCPDYYVTTHLHFDHFDYDALPVVAESSPDTLFFGPSSCTEMMLQLGVQPECCHLLNVGDRYQDDCLCLQAVLADHGDMAPDAIGVLLEMGGHRLYFSGDTALREDVCSAVKAFNPDIAFLSMNGQFGNMSAQDSAKAAAWIGTKYAVPCHFWTFVEHRGDPELFCRQIVEKANCTPVLYRQGEVCVLNGENELERTECIQKNESYSLYTAGNH